MKKILSIILLFAAGLTFTACQSEEDDLFSSSAAERLAASKVTYTQRLPQATAGWVMEYYPTNGDEWPRGSGYLILAKFNSDKSVRMASQNDEMTDDVFMEDTSLWEVIADQGPVLSFNTYNQCLHSFADPAIYETGLGLEGDYEFEIINLEENAQFAMLKGKKRGTYVRMSRLDEGTDFKEYLASVTAFHKKMFNTNVPNKVYISFGDKRYVVTNTENKFMSFYPEGGDEISQTESHPFLISKRGGDYYLRFRDAFEREEMADKVQEMRYDSIQDKFIGVENEQFTIEGYPPHSFFYEYANEKGDHKFEVNVGDEMSDKFKTYMDNLSAEFATLKNKNKPYTFVGLRMTWNARNESFQWVVRYTPGTSTATSSAYNYNFEMAGDRVKFTYVAPGADAKGSVDAATNVRNALSSVAAITDLMSQEFVVTAYQTTFDLTKMKLTSASDPDLWFVVSI